MTEEEILIKLNELKSDPIPSMHKALQHFNTEERVKLEKIVILFEKLNKFNELFDYWYTIHNPGLFLPIEFCYKLLKAIHQGYLKIYPFGKLNEENGELEYFELDKEYYNHRYPWDFGSNQRVYPPSVSIPIIKRSSPQPLANELPALVYPIDKPDDEIKYQKLEYSNSTAMIFNAVE